MAEGTKVRVAPLQGLHNGCGAVDCQNNCIMEHEWGGIQKMGVNN